MSLFYFFRLSDVPLIIIVYFYERYFLHEFLLGSCVDRMVPQMWELLRWFQIVILTLLEQLLSGLLIWIEVVIGVTDTWNWLYVKIIIFATEIPIFLLGWWLFKFLLFHNQSFELVRE